MKKICLLIYAAFCFVDSAFSLTGTWTWISGSNAVNATGVYGTQGVPSVNNYPPAIYDALEWKDKSGNFWIYGGTIPLNTDLWKFNPTTLEWTWIKGNELANQPAVYGTKGVAAAANTPGVRSYTAATWIDTSGALWLMGGDSKYDDMWKYNTSTNMWTWMKGTSTNVKSVHGTQGTPNAANTPGNRDGTCSAWTDASNNLWLFGGFGYEDDGSAGGLEDLWKFNVSTNNWTWMKGSQYIDIAPVYGTQGTAAASNEPGGRFAYTKWTDTQGNLWTFGGLDYNIDLNVRNDMWKYTVSTNNWTWMNGPDVLGDTGTYSTPCFYSTSEVPDSRWYNRSAVTDNNGLFWLFGGFGVDSNLNELWVFDPTTVEWNLVNGPHRSQTASYGSKGVPSSSNMPHSRGGAVAWWGSNDKFYMFGGEGDNSSTIYGDMWMFDPDTSCTSTANRALPVELLGLNAIYAGSSVSLTWSTTLEINNNFFTVERASVNSSEGAELAFAPIGIVKGAGNSTEEMNYKFIDNSPFTFGTAGDGLLYYRLKQTDFDGHYTYSNIVPVKIKNGHSYIIFPNPVKDKFTVYGLQFTVTQLTIYNMISEVVLSYPLSFGEGREETLDASGLPQGIYFLQLKSESGGEVRRFVKE